MGTGNGVAPCVQEEHPQAAHGSHHIDHKGMDDRHLDGWCWYSRHAFVTPQEIVDLKDHHTVQQEVGNCIEPIDGPCGLDKGVASGENSDSISESKEVVNNIWYGKQN